MTSTTSSDQLPTSDKLGESNYHAWSIKVKALLMSKRLWMLVKGIIPSPPAESSQLLEWQQSAYAASGIIMLNLMESQLTHVSGMEHDPALMWTTLEDIHIQKRPNSRFVAYSTLLSITKQPEESLPSVTTRIEQAIKDIVALRPKDYTIQQLDDDLACMAMLRSLPAEYSSFVSTISLMDSISMDKLKTSFITEESNRKALQSQSPASSSTANFVSSTPARPPTRIQTVCTWCERFGHDEESCYSKVASQQWDKDSARSRGQRRRKGSSNTANSTQVSSQQPTRALEQASNTSLSPNTASLTLWCADSGASSHMTPNRHWFSTYRPYVVPIEVADGNIVYSAGIGSVLFKPVVNGVHRGSVEIQSVLHVPSLSKSLLSLTQWSLKCGYKIVMVKGTIKFYLNNSLVCVAEMVGNIACLQGSTVSHALPASAFNTTASPLDINLWHRRFSHLNYNDLKAMKAQNLVNGLVINTSASPDPICEPCLAGNQRRVVNKSATRQDTPLQLIHADLHGPMPTQSPEGYRYFVIFVDDATRFWCLYFLKAKSNTLEAFKAFKAYIELATGRKIIGLQDDKGGEFMSNAFEQFCTESGIQRRHTMRNEPHSNGVAERAIGVISNRSTSLLHESKLPPSFWSRAVSTVVHTHNRMPNSSLKGSTPHFAMLGIKPDVSLLRVFGSVAYVHIQKDKRSGFSPHTEKCVFVGYPAQYKGWEFYNPSTRRFVLSDRADFDERVCPGISGYTPNQVTFPSTPPAPPASNTEPVGDLVVPDVPQQVGVLPVDAVDHQDYNPPEAAEEHEQVVHPPLHAPPQAPPQAPLRRSNRIRTHPAVWRNNWFKAEYTPAARLQQPANDLDAYRDPAPAVPETDSDSEGSADESDTSDDSQHSIEAVNFVSDSSCNYLTLPEALECAFSAIPNRSQYPNTYSEAMSRPDAHLWHEAACKEIDSLLENGTWELARLPAGRRAIGCRWVFVIKHKSDGAVERYKARLVAQGFSQRPGLDYGETYAATVKWATLRCILALGAFEDLEIESVDISSAFLNGEMDAEVYMKQPEGFPQGDDNTVLRLKKSLYGVKQAPRLWHSKLDSILSQLGFTKVESDNSLWIYSKDSVRIILPVFVDDMTLVSKDKAAIDSTIDDLEKHFKLRRLGAIEFLLGVKVDRDRQKRTLHLSQRQYIMDMLKRYGFDSCTPVSTPINPGTCLSQTQCPTSAEEIEEMQTVPYISAVCSLLYLAIATRPDIAYTVGVLARFNTNPGRIHWAAVKHLFRYLKGTMDMRLSFSPDPNASELFVGYSDADHGGDKDTGYSTGSYVIKMGNGTVSWRSKLQDVVTLSTTEAEYISGVHAGQELIWFHNLLTELGYSFSGPHTLYIDNQSAIAFSHNPAHHGRMKHLDLKYLWLRDQVTKKKTICTVYCPTNKMPADIMTKGLPLVKVQEAYTLLGLTGLGGR